MSNSSWERVRSAGGLLRLFLILLVAPVVISSGVTLASVNVSPPNPAVCPIADGETETECRVTSPFTVPAGAYAFHKTLHILEGGSIRGPSGSAALTLSINGAGDNDGDLLVDTGGSIVTDYFGGGGDVGDSTKRAAAIEIATSGNVIMQAGSLISARNLSSDDDEGGGGGDIRLHAGGDKAVMCGSAANVDFDEACSTSTPAGATVTSDKNSEGAGDAGAITIDVGDAQKLPPSGAFIMDTGAVVRANGRNAAGDISISAGHHANISGQVLSQVPTGGTSVETGREGASISVKTGCGLTIAETGVISSRGRGHGADLVHLESCEVAIDGVVQSTGGGHVSPSSPANRCTGALRPDKPANATGCVEVWAKKIAITDKGEINADVNNADTGGPTGQSWIDLFAFDSISIAGRTGSTDNFSVHADSHKASDQSTNTVTAKVVNGTFSAGGRALSAKNTKNGAAGGSVIVEAAVDVDMASSEVIAAGDVGASPTANGGDIAVRSATGKLTWSNGKADVRPNGTGTIALTSCDAAVTTGTNFNSASVVPVTDCTLAPSLPAYSQGADGFLDQHCDDDGSEIDAPPLDPSVATTTYAATEFLYTGSDPIQVGVEPGTIEPLRAGLVRGRVNSSVNALAGETAPLAGVNVTILGHPEYGSTRTRTDGFFDLVVNGGERLTVVFEHDRHFAVQRGVDVKWQGMEVIDDVVLIARDAMATGITFSATAPLQVHSSSLTNDERGQRRATLIIPPATTATMTLPNGTTQALPSATVRATEYTVGPSGPASMPADLPPTSGYTYAAELSVDEAEAAGATNVTFNQPIYHYVENFIGFPVGQHVPAGYYDETKGQWIPSKDGRVIAITGVEGGLAAIDTTGDGAPEDAAALGALGFSDGERGELATRYAAGQSLWRVPVTHFSPWDYNWPYGLPAGAQAPLDARLVSNRAESRNCLAGGSIIECQSQVLGEDVAVAGAPFSLHYRSDRVPGRTSTLALNLTGADPPAPLKRVEVRMEIAGTAVIQSFVPGANLTSDLTWNGRDSYNRIVNGAQPFEVSVSYVYDGVYYASRSDFDASFGLSSGVALTGFSASEIRATRYFTGTMEHTLGSMDARGVGLGGWTPSTHHAYDPTSRTLHLGTGERRSALGIGLDIDTLSVAGGALNYPNTIARAPDGSLYIADTHNHRVRRVGPDGIITPVAGNGTNGFSGDHGPATAAALAYPSALALASDGNLYIADTNNHSVRRVGPDGIITTFAGSSGTSGFSGDGGPATGALFTFPGALAVAPDGSLYIADIYNHRVRRVGPDGVITTVAGNGNNGFSGDGGPATATALAYPNGLALTPDGSLYIADTYNHRVRRVGPDGIITPVAGNGTNGFSGDGGPATASALAYPNGLALDPDGSIYIADTSNHRVRRIGPDGIITTVAGNGTGGFSGDGGPSNAASLGNTYGLALDPDGSIYIADTSNHRVRRVSPDGIITTFAGNAVQGFSDIDGVLATEPGIADALGIAPAPDGSIYVTDSYNNSVRRVGTDGHITTVAGNGNYGFSGDGGPATSALFATPNALALAPDGSLYISDNNNNRVRRIDPGGVITTVAGNGTSGFSGDGGPATAASLHEPAGLALAPDGSFYIADNHNHSVRRVGTDGVITTVAGNGNNGFSGDGGPATGATLTFPYGLAVAPDGSLYIADTGNHRVRRIGPDGVITTVAGNGTSGFSGDGGPAAAAILSVPRALAVAPDGSLYIADDNNNRVRRIGPDGVITTLAGNGNKGFSGDGGPSNAASLANTYGLAVESDGSLLIGSLGTGSLGATLRRVTWSSPGLEPGEVTIPSETGDEAYIFNGFEGRHLRTVDTLTGVVRYRFDYDTAGRLSAITDVDGNVTSIEHDAAGAPTGILGPFGQRTSLVTDANGYLTSIANPAGEAVHMTSSPQGLLTSFADPRGNTSRFTYDASGLLTSDDNAAGGSTTLARTVTATGYAVTKTTAEGRVTRYETERLSNGEVRSTTTDPAGLLSTLLTRPDGTSTATTPDGAVLNATKSPDPRFGMQAPVVGSFTARLPSGTTKTVTTDVSVTLAIPGNPLSLATYTSRTTGNGKTSTVTYGAATRTMTTTTPKGRTSLAVFDATGKLIRAEAPGLAPVTYAYDTRGRITSTTQGEGAEARTSTSAYGSDGFVASSTDAEGRVTSYTRDAAGRVLTSTLPGGRVVRYAYDPSGNTTEITPPGRTEHTFTHTPVDQVASQTPPLVGAVADATTYSYNRDRDPISVTAPGPEVTTYTYNAAGQLVTRSDPTATTTLGYDSAGRLSTTAGANQSLGFTYDASLLTRTIATGASPATIARSYNADMRLASRTINSMPATNFAYDADGLLTGAGPLALAYGATTGQLTGTTLGATTASWSYDTFGAPVSEATALGGSDVMRTSYQRDRLGRITTRTETIAGTSHTFAYSYDTAGRLAEVQKDGTVVESYTYDQNGNRTTGPGATTATYDAQDRMTAYGDTTYTYSPAGRLTTATTGTQTSTYTYDPSDNLTAVTLPDATAVGYKVDTAGRRISRSVNGVMTDGLIYAEGLAPIAATDATGAITSTFTYGSRGNVPDAVVKAGVTYRMVTDHLGSVRLVINATTGAVAQRMDYDTFGNVTTDTNPGFQPFGFAGGLYDPATALTRFGARDYDATTGRWTTKDPIGFAGGDANLYGYVGGDPVNRIDPSGLWCIGDYCTQDVTNFYREVGGDLYDSWNEGVLCEARGSVTSRGFVAQVAAGVIAGAVIGGVCVFTAGVGCVAAAVFAHAATSAVAYAALTPSEDRSWGGYGRYASNPINRYKWW